MMAKEVKPVPTVLTFVRERDTKNMVRYQEEVAAGSEAKVGSFYVSKAEAKDSQRLKMTLEFEG